MDLFIINPVNLWGDYGDVLISGYCEKSAADGPVLLERAGPFLPPISFPGDTIIVSESLKAKMESAMDDSSIPRIQFLKAVYKKIVPIDWHKWNRKADHPKKYPVEGEPENYLFEGKHSTNTALQMESAWQMIIPEFPCVLEDAFGDLENPDGASRPKILFVDRTGYRGVFNSLYDTTAIIDSSLKDWFQKHVPEWVKFSPVTVVLDPTAAQRLENLREYNERIGPHLTDEEYRTRALELCQKHSYAIPAGFGRPGLAVSRYCVVMTDVAPPKLSATSFDSFDTLEEYFLYKQRVSPDPNTVVANILIYDLEAGKRMKYVGDQKFVLID